MKRRIISIVSQNQDAQVDEKSVDIKGRVRVSKENDLPEDNVNEESSISDSSGANGGARRTSINNNRRQQQPRKRSINQKNQKSGFDFVGKDNSVDSHFDFIKEEING